MYIASPHETHYDYAKRALEHGVHVLCEKPKMCIRDRYGTFGYDCVIGVIRRMKSFRDGRVVVVLVVYIVAKTDSRNIDSVGQFF